MTAGDDAVRALDALMDGTLGSVKDASPWLSSLSKRGGARGRMLAEAYRFHVGQGAPFGAPWTPAVTEIQLRGALYMLMGSICEAAALGRDLLRAV